MFRRGATESAGTTGDIRRSSVAEIDEASAAGISTAGEQQRMEVNKEKLRFGDMAA